MLTTPKSARQHCWREERKWHSPTVHYAQLSCHSLCCGNGHWEVLGSGLNSLILVLEENLKAILKPDLEIQCRAGHPALWGIPGVNLGSSG